MGIFYKFKVEDKNKASWSIFIAYQSIVKNQLRALQPNSLVTVDADTF